MRLVCYGDSEPKFTQTDVDSLLANHKRSLQQRVSEQDAKIADLVSKMPQGDERSKLEQELEQSRLAALGEQERRVEQAKKFDEAITVEKGEREKWAGKYRATLLDHTLTGLATEANAFHPRVFSDYLKNFSRVEQAKDANGRYLDSYRVVCRLPDMDADCTPQEAVKHLRETDPNFFKENVSKDVARGVVPGGDGKLDVSKLTAEQHAKLRQTPEGRRALGLRPDPRRMF